MEQTTTSQLSAAHARPWYRLHASTYVMLLLTAAVLLLLNVPGQRIIEFSLYPYERQPEVMLQKQTPLVLVGRHKRQINISHGLAHGWPCTWLVRDAREHKDARTGKSRDTKIWSFTEDYRRFYPGWLAGNIATGLATTAAAGLLFERWRRKRRRIWQQTTCDWLMLIAAVGAATAYALKTARDYQHEREGRRALGMPGSLENDPDSAELFERLGVVTRTTGGPTWLQELLGERRVPWFDRTVQLGVFADRLDHLARFSKLRALTIHGLRLNDERISHLSQLERLELLYLDRASASQIAAPVELAGDTDPDSPNDEQAVARLLGYLVGLNRLEELRLDTRAFGDEAARIVSAFPKLRILIVDRADALTDDGLAALSKCKNLEVLDLGLSKRITSNGLRHLAALPHLKLLALPQSVDHKSVEDLQSRLPALKIEVGRQPFHADEW
jgi:hypothetical protein